MTQLPDVPTFAEAGLPTVNGPAWFGLVAPPGTPASAVLRLQQAVAAAVSRPEIRARIEEAGATPLAGTSESFAHEMQAEYEKWKQVAAQGHISLEAS